MKPAIPAVDPLAGLATPALAIKKKKIVDKTRVPTATSTTNRTASKAEPVPDLAPIRQNRY